MYDNIEEFTELQSILETTLVEYNENTTSPMDLVLFEDAMKLIRRVAVSSLARVMHFVGVGGSGKQRCPGSLLTCGNEDRNDRHLWFV